MKKIPFSQIMITALISIVIIMGVMIYRYPPSVFPDSAHGFQVMHSMETGGGFNRLVGPDQDNIANNTSQFLTWWSPGQYLVPYAIKSILGVNTGKATAIAITLLELSGLMGLHLFFRKIGFTSIIDALSILFIACQQAFITPYIFYNGGEILLFGFEGWFLYGCLSLQKTDLKLLLFVLLSGWIGFFCKSSFIWIYFAGILCVWLRLSSINSKLNIPRSIKTAFWLIIPAAISMGCIYIFFLSKGDNPAGASTGLNFSWQTFSFPLGAPLISDLSIDELMHGLLFPTYSPFLSQPHIEIALILLAILSIALIACIINYVPKNNYRLFVMVFYITSILFFSAAYLRHLTISHEARHFRIIGLLIAPGIIYLIVQLKPAYRVIFGVICVALAFANYSFLAKSYLFNKNVSARGNSGIAQEFIDQPTLNYVMNLDKQNNNAVFVFVSGDIPLEIVHNRVITIEPPPANMVIDYEDYSYDGHAGALYILLPSGYANFQTAMYLKFFPGYASFSKQKLGAKYILYSAK